jgi:S1-C subfamily serine protease
MRILCPACDKPHTVPDGSHGKQFKCKGCGALMTAPRGATERDARQRDDDAVTERPSRRSAAMPQAKERPGGKSAKTDPRRRRGSGDRDEGGTAPWLIPVIGAGGCAVAAAVVVIIYFAFRGPAAPEPVGNVNQPTVAPAPVAVAQPPRPAPTTPNLAEPVTTPAPQPSTPAEKAQPEEPVLAKAATGEQIYQRLLKSTAWIVVKHQASVSDPAGLKDGGKGGPPGQGKQPPSMMPAGALLSTGTGSLIDRKQRLVVTNVHVVGDNPDWVKVHFPKHDGSGLIAQRASYTPEGSINAKIVAKEDRADLALIQLERLPDNVRVLSMASSKAKPGQQVHSVGNPGASQALWIYSPGRVRQVFQDRWGVQNPNTKRAYFYDALKLETDSSINPGDSGGPLVNDRAILVGVAHGHNMTANNMSIFIEISEVRTLIDKYYRSIGETWAPDNEGGGLGEVNVAQLNEWIKKLDSTDIGERVQAVQTMGNLGPDATLAFVPLFKTLKDSETAVRRAAADAIESVPPHKEDLVMLTKVCQDKDEPQDIRVHAVKAIGRLGPGARSALSTLTSIATTSKDELQDAAVDAVDSVGPTAEEAPALTKLLKAAPTDTKRQVLTILTRLGPDAKAAAADIVPLVKSGDRATKIQAVTALQNIGGGAKEVVSGLSDAIKDADKEVAIRAAAALMKMGETKAAVPFFSGILSNKSMPPPDRIVCVRVLMTLGPDAKAATKDLCNAIEEDQLGPLAMEALVRIGPGAAQTVANKMVALLKNPQAAQARLRCIITLDRIGTTSTDIQKALLAVYNRDSSPENRTAASLVGNKLVQKR